MEAEQKEVADWRCDISEPADTLKIADKETITIVFLDEGKKNVHPDYGTSIAFRISKEKEEKIWYVNSKNFDLLGQIKALGKITGIVVSVTRFGNTKSNTRYILKKV
jgi:hypothetical protein